MHRTTGEKKDEDLKGQNNSNGKGGKLHAITLGTHDYQSSITTNWEV